MDRLTVYKLDAFGNEQIAYPAVRLDVAVDNGICVRAEWQIEVASDLFHFRPGDYAHEYFYRDQYYNIFANYRCEDGAFSGWYCNLCRPAAIDSTSIRCEDLALDLWVTPDGRLNVLDAAEFEELALSEEERTRCLSALQQLKQLGAAKKLPR